MLDPEDPDVRVAVFGKQVEDFLTGDVGDYLIKQAQYEITTATEKLVKTASWRRRRIQDLQNEIYRAESFKDWLGFAVQAGIQATNRIQGDEE